MFYTTKILIPTEGDEVRDTRAFETKDEALSRFHTDMANAVNKDTTASVLEMLFDGDGAMYKNEKWVKSST